MSDSPGKRLALFRKSLNLSQRKFAEACGVSGGLVGQIEADLIAPSRAFLQKMSQRFHVSSDWFLHGKGEMYLDQSTDAAGKGFVARRAEVSLPDTTKPAHGDVALNGVDFQLISRFEVEAGAGPGRLALSDERIDQIAFTRSWLLRLGLNGDLAGLIKVRGDSMGPHIRDGSLALVHFAEFEVESGQIYAFTLNDELYVKRLVKLEDGWLITSDNPAHPPRQVVGDEASRLRVHGRVRAVISEY